jgi:hypothetical protein
MREPPPPLTADDKIFLIRLRNDIVARSEFYLLGMDYLQLRLSVDRLYEADLAVWERKCEIDPTTAKPNRDSVDYCLSRRLIRVFSELLNEGLSTPDDDLNPYDVSRAKAVLVLTWLLTDKEANRHPFGVVFGVWGATPELRIALKGRAMARVATLDELNGSCRARWMELARQAWQVLMVPGDWMVTPPQQSIGTDVSVERIWHLPIPDEFKRVVIDAISFVLAHPERFDDAAKAINAELEAKLRENADDDGQLYSPAYWLTYMLPDAIEAGPPALGNGPNYEYAAWWQRVMLLTTLAVYPGDLSRFGMCGAIPWDHGTASGQLGDDPKGLPVPVSGRAWMLFELAETLQLRPEMQDKAGEYVEHRYGELVDGKLQDVVKRTPWQTPGVLRKLVDRLQPILRELGPLPDPVAVALVDAIDRWGEHNDEPPYVQDMLDKAITACKAWGEDVGGLVVWRNNVYGETPPWAYQFLRLLREAAASTDPAAYLREKGMAVTATRAPANVSRFREGKSDQADAVGAKQEQFPSSRDEPKKPKRSTERGEGEVKIIAALTKHHGYADGSCLNLEPIGNNRLAREAQVSASTASAFFQRKFQGHVKYRVSCQDASKLAAALKLLNQEFSPHHLYGAKPPAGNGREEE